MQQPLIPSGAAHIHKGKMLRMYLFRTDACTPVSHVAGKEGDGVRSFQERTVYYQYSWSVAVH